MYTFYFLIFLVVGTVGFFHLAGREDHARGWLWGGISAALWALSFLLFHWGILGGLFLQLCLFGFMTGRNMWRNRHSLIQGPAPRNRRTVRDPDEILYE